MAIVVPPCGLTPLGLWTPTLPPNPAVPVLRLAEAIDPTTRALAGTGGADPVEDMVLLALQAVRLSGATLDTTGQRFGRIRKMGGTVEADVKAEARQALEPLIKRGHIRVESYQVLAGPDWWELTVTWTNLRTGATGQTTRVQGSLAVEN